VKKWTYLTLNFSRLKEKEKKKEIAQFPCL